jgi:hypothetical protein
MSTHSFDPTDPRVELEIFRERLKNSEERNRQLEENLKQLYTDLGRKEEELRRIREEREELKLKWELAKNDLRHQQDKWKQVVQVRGDKRRRAVRYIIGGNLLICLAGILVALGTGLLISASPNSLGWVIIVVSVIIYFAGSVFITTKGGNE